MSEFTELWLKRQGLSMSQKNLHDLSNMLEGILEVRVGKALYTRFSSAQIDEFATIIENTDDNDVDSKRLDWLEKNYPNYKAVVKYQKTKLSKEVRNTKDKAPFIRELYKKEV